MKRQVSCSWVCKAQAVSRSSGYRSCPNSRVLLKLLCELPQTFDARTLYMTLQVCLPSHCSVHPSHDSPETSALENLPFALMPSSCSHLQTVRVAPLSQLPTRQVPSHSSIVRQRNPDANLLPLAGLLLYTTSSRASFVLRDSQQHIVRTADVEVRILMKG